MSLMELLELESSETMTGGGEDFRISGEPLFPRPSKEQSREGAKRARARRREIAHSASDELVGLADHSKIPTHILDARRLKVSRLRATAGFNRAGKKKKRA